MEKRETGVGAYYFCDIAMSYFPLLSKKKASDKLSRWIRVSGKLMERLEECGWHPRQRILSPRQRECIVSHLVGGFAVASSRGGCVGHDLLELGEAGDAL